MNTPKKKPTYAPKNTAPKPPGRPKRSFFEYALRVTRYRLRLADLGTALLLMLALGVAGGLAMVIADHSAAGGLRLWTRWGFRWILIGAEACLLVVLVLLPLLRRISDLYVARQMEKADPSLHNDLTAAVQLPEQSGPAGATAAAVRRSASRQAARMPTGAPVNLRGLRLASLAAGLACLAFLGYWIFAPKSVVRSLGRVLGTSTLAAPTRTEFLSQTPADETTVLTGDEVVFETRVRHPEGPVVLTIARDKNTVLDEDTITMMPTGEPGPGKEYRATWKASSVRGWARFRLRCGDAETTWRQLRVLPTPALRQVRVRQVWPKYTGRAPSVREGGHVEGPVGTLATVRADVNLPVLRASLVFEPAGRVYVMKPDKAGRSISATFRITTPGRYRIRYELRDIEAEAESIAYDVNVTPDRPPSVRLTTPAKAITLAENESLRLAGEAMDDFGMGEIELVCKNGQKTRTHPLSRHSAPGVSSRQLTHSLPVSKLGQAGETLQCVVQARDFRPSPQPGDPAGQMGTSETFLLTIRPPTSKTKPPEKDEKNTEQQALSNATGEQEGEGKKNGPEDGLAQAVRDELGADQKEAKKLDQLREAMNEGKENSAGPQAAPKENEGQTNDHEKKKDGGENGKRDQKEGEQGNGEKGNGQKGDGQEGKDKTPGTDNATAGAQDAQDHTSDGEGTGRREGELAKVDNEALTPGQVEALESIGRALNTARRDIEDNAVDPKLLEAMGMTLPEFKGFVDTYTQRYEQAKRKFPESRKHTLPPAPAVGKAGVQKGTGAQVDNVATAPTLEKQKDTETSRERAKTVSPEYRRQLDAYFRAVSEGND